MNRTVTTRTRLLGTTVLAGVGLLLAAVPAIAQESAQMETVTVTGYRASLADSANAKRASVSFSDSVFAEDMGKFPDTNLAESLNRIPGVTIVREVDGEGLQVQVRGLGTNFTKVLLNGATVAVASTGRTDAQGQNREVDLNMFPSELFTQLTVSKTSTADQLEGGMAVVNMRTQRPFDNPGFHFNYNLQGTMGSVAGKLGERGTLIVSDTEGPFGVLLGVSGVHNLVRTEGFETIGWASARLSAAQCEQATRVSSTGAGYGYTLSNASCQSLNRGGQGWQVPATLSGATVDAAYLAAQNPDMARASRTVVATDPTNSANTSTYTVLSNDALSNALMPRLARPADQWGHRDRFNGVLSLEFRPDESLHFYIDSIGGRIVNQEHRTDMMFQVRNSADVPTQIKTDANGIVTSGVFQNVNMFLEDRPYYEKGDFFSINPGMDWQVTDLLKVEAQANASRSHFFRSYPSVGLFTQATTVNYTNNGSIPTFTTTGVDLQDPHSWNWSGARAWIQNEKRYSYTDGARLDVSYGGDLMTVRVGAAYDEVYRNIIPLDNSRAWQAAVCGNNPSIFVQQAPNSDVPCNGDVYTGTQTAGTAIHAGYPAYPGLGTGYTAGQSLSWGGSLIPRTDVYKYLIPGKQGYAIVDWPKFRDAAQFAQYNAAAPFATSSNTSAKAGTVREQTIGLYGEISGAVHPGERALKYNIGLRWIETLQGITGVSRSITDPRNSTLQDGGLYPTTNVFTTVKSVYQAFLPSLNLVYEITDDFQVRGAITRTMTRPDPSNMLPGAAFSDPSAALATVGNSALKPYYSTNIDLGWELYTTPGSYFGMMAFRKSISGFTVTGVTNHTFGELAPYGIRYADLSATQRGTASAPTRFSGCTDDASCASVPIQFQQAINASGLMTINGMEFTLQQSLDFLTEPYLGIKGFGFNGNVTVVDQKGSGAAPAIATGVAPYTYNMTAYYENEGFMLRAMYNYTGVTYNTGSNQNSVCIGGNGCPGGAYQMGAAYAQLDMSASLKLGYVLGETLPTDPEVTFDVINVLQAKQKAYFQWQNAPFTVYKPGIGFMFGVRGSL